MHKDHKFISQYYHATSQRFLIRFVLWCSLLTLFSLSAHSILAFWVVPVQNPVCVCVCSAVWIQVFRSWMVNSKMAYINILPFLVCHFAFVRMLRVWIFIGCVSVNGCFVLCIEFSFLFFIFFFWLVFLSIWMWYIWWKEWLRLMFKMENIVVWYCLIVCQQFVLMATNDVAAAVSFGSSHYNHFPKKNFVNPIDSIQHSFVYIDQIFLIVIFITYKAAWADTTKAKLQIPFYILLANEGKICFPFKQSGEFNLVEKSTLIFSLK